MIAVYILRAKINYFWLYNQIYNQNNFIFVEINPELLHGSIQIYLTRILVLLGFGGHLLPGKSIFKQQAIKGSPTGALVKIRRNDNGFTQGS